MSKENLFGKALEGRRKGKKQEPVETSIEPEPSPEPPSAPVEPLPTKKRGRPATGKRSAEGWIGRTYYVQRETDLDVETELLDLKRSGAELDKSELVNSLLTAWVKWRNGENSDFLLGDISPRRKDGKVR